MYICLNFLNIFPYIVYSLCKVINKFLSGIESERHFTLIVKPCHLKLQYHSKHNNINVKNLLKTKSYRLLSRIVQEIILQIRIIYLPETILSSDVYNIWCAGYPRGFSYNLSSKLLK